MIPIGLYLVWLFVVLGSAGMLAKRGLEILATCSPKNNEEPAIGSDLPSVLLLGIVLITTITSLVSLYHRIDLITHITISLLVIALGGRFLLKAVRKIVASPRSPRMWLFIALGAAGIATMTFVATDQTTHFDTGLYHWQAVKWTTLFGSVPGLANLQVRFGFNSAWEIFASFLDQGFFSHRSFHVVSLVIGSIFLVACLQGFLRWMEGNKSTGTIVRCLGVLVLLHGYRELLPSLSTDWPAMLLLYYVLILAVESSEELVDRPNTSQIKGIQELGVIAALAVFAVTIKLSAAPILFLLCLLWLRFPSSKLRAALVVLVCSVCVMLPCVARNVVLTGYPFYPFAALDLFNFDWKVPRQDVQFMATLLKYWAFNPGEYWYDASEMSLREQIRAWITLRGPEAGPFLTWLGLGTIAWITATVVAKIRGIRGYFIYFPFVIAFAAGFVFYVFTAPDPRYALGWSLVYGLMGLACLLHVVGVSWPLELRWWQTAGWLLLLGSLLWLGRFAGVKRLVTDRGRPLWQMADFPPPELKEVRTEYGLAVRVPVRQHLVWDAALPATILPSFNPWLQTRGPSLGDGFRVTKPYFDLAKQPRHATTRSQTEPPTP